MKTTTYTPHLILSILLFSVFSFVNAQDYLVIKGDTTFLETDSVFLSVDEYRGQIQWQATQDSIDWVDIAGANADTLFVLIDSTASYRAMIVENTCDPVFSDTIFVFEERKTTLSNKAVFISADLWEANLDEANSDTAKYIFKTLNNHLDTIEPGQIIFSDFGEGVLKKVIDVVYDSVQFNTEIKTVPACIEDLYEDLYVEFTDTVRDDFEELSILTKNASLSPIGKKGLDIIHYDLAYILHDADGDYNTKNDQIRLSGEYKLVPQLRLKMKIKKFKIRRLYWEYVLDNVFDFTLEVSNGIKTGDKLKGDIFKKPKKLGKIPIPGTPIVLFPELQIEVGAELGVDSEVEAGIRHQEIHKFALLFENGVWREDKSHAKETTPVLPAVGDIKLYAKAFAKPEIAFKIYGIVGPYLDLEAYGELDVIPFYDPWWQFYLGAKLGAGVKMEVFNKTQFDESFEIFDYKYVIAHAKTLANLSPVAACKVSPKIGRKSTQFTFSAIGCSDNEDNELKLKVRWDWNNDGIWDTPFSKEKITYKKFTETGQHTIKLEVMDTDGATGVTTTTINVEELKNIAPKANFYYKPKNPIEGEKILLNASASYDPDGSDALLKYAWDWDNNGELDTPFGKSPIVYKTFNSSGNYKISLAVLDEKGEMNIFWDEIYVGAETNHETGTLTDIDGNTYKTVKIGEQVWMAENLKATRYPNGDAIPFLDNSSFVALEDNNTDDGAGVHGVNSNNEADHTSNANYNKYGVLYNYAAAIGDNWERDKKEGQGVCPDGWHLPSDDEWKTLEMELGMSQNEADATGTRSLDVGTKLKTSTGWDGRKGSNEVGFSALPAGVRDYENGTSDGIGLFGIWLSATQFNKSHSYCRVMVGAKGVDDYLPYANAGIQRSYSDKSAGFSIRCIKNSYSKPKASFYINKRKVSVGEKIKFNDQSTDSPENWLWDFGNGMTSSSQNPILTYYTEGIYTVKLIVSNDNGSSELKKMDFIIVGDPTSNIKTGTVIDIDSNIYRTVKMGNQWWMSENLKVTKYPDGTAIPHVSHPVFWKELDLNEGDAYCFYNNDESLGYGALYSFSAATNGNNSGNDVQGVCPDGWHLPSQKEWQRLKDLIAIDGNISNESTVLKATNGWQSSPGNGTDYYGFRALPGGQLLSFHSPIGSGMPNFGYAGFAGYWWSSLEYGSNAYGCELDNSFDESDIDEKKCGKSVRCVKD